MGILEKLNETVEAMQDFKALESAHDLVEYFNTTYRGKLGEAFFKCDFDKSEYGNGVVFIRYARCPYSEATNQMAMESDFNFIVAVEGFDADGGLCENCGDFYTQMMVSKLPDGVRKMRRMKHHDINYVKNYTTKYFDAYLENLDEEGPGTVTGDVAVVKSKLGGPMLQPPEPNKRKKKPYSYGEK